ncbi:CubicO group peptidase, beta-lactamase class C family [Bryocella elongata]|uniref:CubicO group peptidase, beta-lactamase class C family n=1 Tax=Bryocella elongata TaxID=863522 RepID=A0A1H6BM53_9BACT|nr:serine hydrolase domain-containing protein [Bryocella elongata]SEG61781.1 CubicO group peptidase, beta-lactamase class C family [Bryocella elongata]
MRAIACGLLFVFFVNGFTHAQLPADSRAKVETLATETLRTSGVPSASVGIVSEGEVSFTQAFGLAHVSPDVKASAAMAYPIGSISKQFTSAALLLLQQEGKLSLDDKVGKYFPELTRSNDITIRNLLTMTSGYEDNAPQDYIIPSWLKPVDPLTLVRQWAEKPLDFEPGTDWQYSNTNYVVAGLIVEKVTGQPLMKFLRERIFTPLKLEGIVNTYTEREKLEVTGYVSYAMAPVREQALEGTGWCQGDGDLAMPVATLLKWDLSIMNQTLLKPESYKELETPFVLKDGRDSGYGLGINVRMVNGHRMISHSGEVGGFVSDNVMYPEDHFAVAVLTNEVAASAAAKIANGVTGAMIPAVSPAKKESGNRGDSPRRFEAVPETGVLKGFGAKLATILDELEKRKIDRKLFTFDCNAYFSADALKDFSGTLTPYGPVTNAILTGSAQRGGMTFAAYAVSFEHGPPVRVTLYLQPDGAIEQLLVTGKL